MSQTDCWARFKLEVTVEYTKTGKENLGKKGVETLENPILKKGRLGCTK